MWLVISRVVSRDTVEITYIGGLITPLETLPMNFEVMGAG